MSTDNPTPRRGEIWIVDLNPTKGSELYKKRPAVVISSDFQGGLPVRLVAPLTDWKPFFSRNLWHVQVEPDGFNGLEKRSAADVMQVRSLDIQRFIAFKGKISAVTLEEIVAALTIVVEYQ